MTRRSALRLLLAGMWAPLPALAQDPEQARPSATLRVGPTRPLKTLSEAARSATAGTRIEVDAGTYRADTAVWERDGVALQAVGGRVRLEADGAAVEGKGIWVVRARGISVRGFDFSGARVPSLNGAGIRLDRGSLQVRDCSFLDNECGILTGNDAATELEVEDSEFARNLTGDGQSHLLYAGAIGRLVVRRSYFHDANVGHLLKSRAAVNLIQDNRLTDEGGSASYELEFAIGGVAHVTGNVIQQSARTQNPAMVSYGAEGYRWPSNVLHLLDNTFIDELPGGGVYARVVQANPAQAVDVRAIGNTLRGAGRWELGAAAVLRDNVTAGPTTPSTRAAGPQSRTRAR